MTGFGALANLLWRGLGMVWDVGFCLFEISLGSLRIVFFLHPGEEGCWAVLFFLGGEMEDWDEHWMTSS